MRYKTFDRLETQRNKLRTYRYLLLFIALAALFAFVTAELCYGILREAETHYFIVEGDSMNPTLYNGDKIPATARFKKLMRGDIVIFPPDRYLPDSGVTIPYVKGVVAVAGDVIYQRGKEIRVVAGGRQNGVLPDGVCIITDYAGRLLHSETTVKTGEVYVLGDNYNDSNDSSKFGPVRIEDITYLVRNIKSKFYYDLL